MLELCRMATIHKSYYLECRRHRGRSDVSPGTPIGRTVGCGGKGET